VFCFPWHFSTLITSLARREPTRSSNSNILTWRLHWQRRIRTNHWNEEAAIICRVIVLEKLDRRLGFIHNLWSPTRMSSGFHFRQWTIRPVQSCRGTFPRSASPNTWRKLGDLRPTMQGNYILHDLGATKIEATNHSYHVGLKNTKKCYVQTSTWDIEVSCKKIAITEKRKPNITRQIIIEHLEMVELIILYSWNNCGLCLFIMWKNAIVFWLEEIK